MNKKKETYSIRSVANGFIVEYSYRDYKSESDFDYTYVTEENVFLTWDDVLAYITKQAPFN